MKRHTIPRADEHLRSKRRRSYVPATSSNSSSNAFLTDAGHHRSYHPSHPIATRRSARRISQTMMSSSVTGTTSSPRPTSPSSTLSSSRVPWPTGHFHNPIPIHDGYGESQSSATNHALEPRMGSMNNPDGMPNMAVKAASSNALDAQTSRLPHSISIAASPQPTASSSSQVVPEGQNPPFPVDYPSNMTSSSVNNPTGFGSPSPQFVAPPRLQSTLSTSTSASTSNMDAPGHNHQQNLPGSVPSWQPDSEATRCPICDVHFTFFCRKHHCRKCGRIICASCSPHRLPVPRQYIVEPPPSIDSSSPPRHDAGHYAEGQTSSNTNLSDDPPLDGQRDVRLCNTCVSNIQVESDGQGSIPSSGSRSQFPGWYTQSSNRPRVCTFAISPGYLEHTVDVVLQSNSRIMARNTVRHYRHYALALSLFVPVLPSPPFHAFASVINFSFFSSTGIKSSGGLQQQYAASSTQHESRIFSSSPASSPYH